MPRDNEHPAAIPRTFGCRRHLRHLIATALLILLGPARAADPHFDCNDAFELISLATTLRCDTDAGPPAGTELIDAARNKLIDSGFHSAADFDAVDVRWCRLGSALGFTPGPAVILIDSGLAAGTVDLVAEVLAHEMVHATQFAALGADGFRCAYVNAFLRCGGCQDRGHALEAEAYKVQDDVRERLHADWLRR